ncbi:hypothetical protein ACVWYF_000105 [Hymenobacter sp. UYAg731]
MSPLLLLPCCFLLLLFADAMQAQPVLPNSTQAIHPSNCVFPAAMQPPLLAGDTVYVMASLLNIRPRPRADGPGNPLLYIGHNRQGTVVAVPNRNWVLVRFTSEDVGIVGYASQWYLARQKTKLRR